jgi:recombination protein RecT
MSNLALKPTMTLKDWVESDAVKSSLEQVLPDKRIIGQFLMLARMSFAKTPQLASCTKESVLQCLMSCGQYGLLPDGRHAHLIPYKDKCTLIIDYKGVIALATRAGISGIFAEVVYENDGFTTAVKNGRKELIHTYKAAEERGKPIAFYSCSTFNNVFDFEVMTVAEVDAIKARSRAGGSGPWVTDYLEMGKKTVIRRHSKRWDITPELAAALAVDDDKIDEDSRFAKAKPVTATCKPTQHQDEPQAQETTDTPADTSAPVDYSVEAKVKDWKERTGETNGKKWKITVFSLEVDGKQVEATTFSQTDAADIISLSSTGPVRLVLKDGKKGKEIAEVVK